MKGNNFFIKLAISTAIFIFVIGLFVPLGIAEAVPYIFVVLITLWIPGKKSIYVAGIITTILTIIGVYFDPSKISDWSIIIANTAISVMVIWACVFVVLRQKKVEESEAKSKEKLEQMNATLEDKVSQRTNELTVAIKELEQSRAELQNTLGKEQQLNEMKSRFIVMASHEFRTPLSAILSSTSLVEKYEQAGQKEKMKKHLTRIRSSVKDLTTILEEFLSLEKLESGNVELVRKTFNLREFCEDVIEEIQAIMKKGQLINYEHIGDENINEDKKILQHVLLNLLSNACKYSEDHKEINLYTEVSNNKICIKVIDNGIGIPEEEQKNVFSRFFRAENTANIQGTGLGLSIVKRYVELIDGTITFTSHANEGTTFIVEFPKIDSLDFFGK